MRYFEKGFGFALLALSAVLLFVLTQAASGNRDHSHGPPAASYETQISQRSQAMLEEGRRAFRYDTFGDEAYWGDTLQLHKAIETVSPRTALAVGLKVDVDALPQPLINQLRAGRVDLDDPAVTLALLKLNAVVGVTGYPGRNGGLRSIGIQCAFCHSTVDDALAPGIGHRLDGWANRDLDVGAIVALAPNLQPIADLLLVDVETVKRVLTSWGPGRFDAELDKDGKAFRPDGGQAGTLIPPAFGLAGVNLHTWTGFGSVPYWNAYVAATEMHGSGTYFDERLSDASQYPVAARTGSWNTRGEPDLITRKLPALHVYQLALPAPKPPSDSFDARAAGRGKEVFADRCSSCHVPPLFTEPGHNLHSPVEMGIDAFQADRSPTHAYRTAPLAGLWTHQKGGFYHDGRYATLDAVIDHYESVFGFTLSDQQQGDLKQYLLSL